MEQTRGRPAGGPLAGIRVVELAHIMAGHAPLTLRATKEALRRLQFADEPGSDRDLILMCYTSEDFREGMDALLDKRPPRWRGV
jgi:enoyl-CoA hydratase